MPGAIPGIFFSDETVFSEKKGHLIPDTPFRFVHLCGVEPQSMEPESIILSIELQVLSCIME